MTAKPLLFDDLARSRPRINRGHVIDAGDGDPIWARLRCSACRHEWEVFGGYTHRQLLRGIACPVCWFCRAVTTAAPAKADFPAFLFQPFDPFAVRRMAASLPPISAYRPLPHPDAPEQRFAVPLYDMTPSRPWREIALTLRSDRIRSAIATALGLPAKDMHPAVALVRDLPGYKIGIHPDTHRKLATVQVFLAANANAPHIGTRFHRQMADGAFTQTDAVPYLPGSGYFFRRSPTSWHSVNPTTQQDGERNSIMLIYFDSPKSGFT